MSCSMETVVTYFNFYALHFGYLGLLITVYCLQPVKTKVKTYPDTSDKKSDGIIFMIN